MLSFHILEQMVGEMGLGELESQESKELNGSQASHPMSTWLFKPSCNTTDDQ